MTYEMQNQHHMIYLTFVENALSSQFLGQKQEVVANSSVKAQDISRRWPQKEGRSAFMLRDVISV